MTVTDKLLSLPRCANSLLGENLKILVWGLGYVGTVTAACLADLGHQVVGVEPNPSKVTMLTAGQSPVKEPGLDALVNRTVDSDRLRAVSDGISLVPWADVSLICVGTPSEADGSLMLNHLRKVASDIASGLRESKKYHVVAVRSTVFPGVTRNILGRILEDNSQQGLGRDFGLVMNPEFMREASAIDDFYKPSYTVIGALDSQSGDLIEELYRPIHSTIYRVSLEEAEILKLCNNAFHALKIGFANEVGRLCDKIGIDSHAVMELICADRKLNISPAYLMPGFAFGGSCLPKDVRSLTYHARRLGIDLPIIEGILPSNRVQTEAARLKILQTGAQRVGVLGLSFKPNTDDLRESPTIGLIRDLWQDGIDVMVHDPDVQPEQMLGSNLEYLERQLPQIHRILRADLNEIIEKSQLIVVAQKRPEFAARLNGLNGKTTVLDLVHMNENPKLLTARGKDQETSW
jgi:GDP-mannose 6-dehydrogenase